jgi:tRNA A-37 threonylcarbamoyl transferase component Bud32
VQVVPLDAETSRLARAWAAAACDGLPAVLRLDAASREIWLESPRGTSLAAGLEPLGSREAALVRSALERLHAQGVAHGAVDRAHLFSHEGTIVLAFDADSARGANAPDDLKALAGLA